MPSYVYSTLIYIYTYISWCGLLLTILSICTAEGLFLTALGRRGSYTRKLLFTLPSQGWSSEGTLISHVSNNINTTGVPGHFPIYFNDWVSDTVPFNSLHEKFVHIRKPLRCAAIWAVFVICLTGEKKRHARRGCRPSVTGCRAQQLPHCGHRGPAPRAWPLPLHRRAPEAMQTWVETVVVRIAYPH